MQCYKDVLQAYKNIPKDKKNVFDSGNMAIISLFIGDREEALRYYKEAEKDIGAKTMESLWEIYEGNNENFDRKKIILELYPDRQ